MAAEKTKLGKVTCINKRCVARLGGLPTLYLEMNTANQTISYKCPECGVSGFAKKGESSHKDFLEELGDKAPKPTTKVDPEPSDPPPTNTKKTENATFWS